MKNPESLLPDLKELGILLLGFLPWLLFLFLSGNTLASLERAIVISLIASLIFGFRELRSGYILTWGTLVFFSSCAILVNIFKVVWVASQMSLLANSALAVTMWLTLLLGKPFALQYARKGLPKEHWNDPNFIRGCRFITVVWACLMSLSALVSLIHRIPGLKWPEWVFFLLSMCIMLTGLTFTTVYKRQKRLKRERNV
jgi:hypothetical protein